MPSRTSKPSPGSPIRRSPWKAERACSELRLAQLAQALGAELGAGDRVFLEGPLGAGKTTFARSLLEALGVRQPPEGSPTFAIAHEYEGPRGAVAHIDFYRLGSEEEIEEAGIPSYFGERPMVVLCEWISSWPEFERSVLKQAAGKDGGRCYRVGLAFDRGSLPDSDQRRDVLIERYVF